MKFQTKTDEQLQRESLIPEGEYDFEVVSAKDATSKAGNEMIALELDVFVNGSARPCRDWLMEAMAYKLKHFCQAVGLAATYEQGTLTADACVGRTGKVHLVIKNNEKFGPQNSVKDYTVAKSGVESPHVPAPSPRLPAAAPVDDPNSTPF